MAARLTLTGAGWLLPAVLSTTAGAVDVIGFLALGGLFTAHITGNVVILAAHYVVGGFSEVGPLVDFDTLSARLIEYVGYTPIHNIAGAPAMSVPLNWTDAGLPVGSMFSARRGNERTLFELAYQLEAAQPWAHRIPPIHA